jgi:hypothetical protein
MTSTNYHVPERPGRPCLADVCYWCLRCPVPGGLAAECHVRNREQNGLGGVPLGIEAWPDQFQARSLAATGRCGVVDGQASVGVR